MSTYRIGERIDIQLTPLYDDLGDADSVAIEYQKPGGDTGQWAAILFGNYVRYITTTTDILAPGDWKFRPIATFGDEVKKGNEWIIRTFKA